MPEIVIGPTDRVLIVGRSGSGKSTLARAMFYGQRNLVVVDTKHEEVLPRSLTVFDAAGFRQAFPQRSTRILFRPDPDDVRGLELDQVARRILTYGRTMLLIHDVGDFATATRIVPGLRRAVKLGRSVSAPVVALSQRPIGLHNDITAEANHIFAFDLSLEDDRKKIAGVGGPGFLEGPPDQFGFLYWGEQTTGGAVVRCPPLDTPAASPPSPADAPNSSAQPGGASWSGRPSAT